jgi:site-specific DNA recombinase
MPGNQFGKLRISNVPVLGIYFYEDNVLSRVTNEQFRMLSGGYNEEQSLFEQVISQLENEIEDLKASVINIERFF